MLLCLLDSILQQLPAAYMHKPPYQNVSPTPLSFLAPLLSGGPISPTPVLGPKLILRPLPKPLYLFVALAGAMPGMEDPLSPLPMVVLREGVGVRTSPVSSSSWCGKDEP